jgi:hypothetical protein
MLNNIHFTDPQGVVHTDAVFIVRSGYENTNTSTEILLSKADWVSVVETTSVQPAQINYQVYYWSSPTAKANGAMPYILADSATASMDYFFQVTDAYAGLTLEVMIEKHLTDVVLPPMLVV